jgi:hypothetical protein
MLASRYKVAGDTSRKIVTIAARHRSETDAIKERTEAADREPLSGWDAVAYAEYRREKPEASPLIGVRLYLMSVAWKRTWDEVLACTIRADIDALVRWHLDFRIEHGYQIPNYADIIPDDVHGPY